MKNTDTYIFGFNKPAKRKDKKFAEFRPTIDQTGTEAAPIRAQQVASLPSHPPREFSHLFPAKRKNTHTGCIPRMISYIPHATNDPWLVFPRSGDLSGSAVSIPDPLRAVTGREVRGGFGIYAVADITPY